MFLIKKNITFLLGNWILKGKPEDYKGTYIGYFHDDRKSSTYLGLKQLMRS